MGSSSGFNPKTSALIVSRDGGRCFKCGKRLDLSRRGIDWSAHHRRPRAMGGAGKKAAWVNLASNGVLLDGSGTTGCHGYVETHRREARELGYLVPLNGIIRPCNVPILRWDGALVFLTDDGQALPIGET